MSRIPSNGREGLTRRGFAQIFAIGGSAALFARCGSAWPTQDPLLRTPAVPDERFWSSVRDQFVMPPDLAYMNAANLCPSSRQVLETMYSNTEDIDKNTSSQNRAKMGAGKEAARELVAAHLGVSAEDIVLCRNTSEGNNLVSSGVVLGPDDEVIIHADNHPSNNAAWKRKAERYGFTVRTVAQVNPHPGHEYYVEAFTKEMNARTKVIAFSHLTNTTGDLLPAKELCRVARERGILTLVDGAQTFGLMDIDLADMQPDFYTGSGHKWPCGPKEVGVLYIHKDAQSKIWPSVYSAISGRTGISRSMESFGQRDDPALIAFGEAMSLQQKIGVKNIQDRSQELAQALMTGLAAMDGVTVWTSRDPSQSVAVVSVKPGDLDTRRLSTSLYENDGISCATNRGGLRFSPHFFVLHAEIDRALAAIRRALRTGV
jgi:selenocysteine lyase/cysteine desulfurase